MVPFLRRPEICDPAHNAAPSSRRSPDRVLLDSGINRHAVLTKKSRNIVLKEINAVDSGSSWIRSFTSL